MRHRIAQSEQQFAIGWMVQTLAGEIFATHPDQP
jgi:hypothetical protein